MACGDVKQKSQQREVLHCRNFNTSRYYSLYFMLLSALVVDTASVQLLWCLDVIPSAQDYVLVISRVKCDSKASQRRMIGIIGRRQTFNGQDHKLSA